jgi:DNA-3-methyladenine glycosylase II
VFAIDPQGPFSLQLAAGFGFGPDEGKPEAEQPVLRLAFLLDDLATLTAVTLTQEAPDGPVRGVVHPEAGDGAAKAAATADQVARILSLDHDARPYARLADEDPVLGTLMARYPGLRPVLFHSPYEAAAWALISHRRPQRQAAATRAALAARLGKTYTFSDGHQLHAFPAPLRLLDDLRPDTIPGLPAARVDRLHALAEAALDGALDPATLRAYPDTAMQRLQQLPGIGPFWATLVVVRSTGATDVLATGEPRLQRAVQKAYNLPEPPDAATFAAIAERWRPFRTWAGVLHRYAAGRADGF